MQAAHFHLEHIFALSAECLWDCWTDSEHLSHFFIPKPHRMKSCDLQLKVGGRFNTCFEVAGQEICHQGVVLALVTGQKIVFSDSHREGWIPQADASMTVIVNVEALSAQTSRCHVEVHAHAMPEIEQFQYLDVQLGWQMVLQQLADYLLSSQQRFAQQQLQARLAIADLYNLT